MVLGRVAVIMENVFIIFLEIFPAVFPGGLRNPKRLLETLYVARSEKKQK